MHVTSDRLLLGEAVHDFVTEYLEPQGVSEHTVRAYTADISGIARLVAAAALPEARGLTGRELALLAHDRVDESDVDGLTVADLTSSHLRRAFGAWTATHAVASARRAHSAWTRFFDHLT